MSQRGGSLSSTKKSSKQHGASPTAAGIYKVTKMIKGPKAGIKHSPSSYLADMRMSTEEKLTITREMYPPKIIELLDISTTSHQKDTNVHVDQALFQPFPSEVIFQQFEPHHTYEFPLQLRNLDKVARLVKVTHQESPYFTVTCQRLSGSKVAPGMEITYHVVFTPDEKKDYEHELVCVTEREKFTIPVRAIGARALLDFPDEVNFSSAPVKYHSTKTVLVRNVGNREAKFNMATKSPFSVSPSSATLAVNDCMQVTIGFTPNKIGDHLAELSIHYDTGEEVYTLLYGSSNNVNVRLDRSSITLENTYIGLSSQRSVMLHNRSDVVVQFQWKAFSSEYEEEMQREIRAQQFAEEEALSKDAFFERCMHNPSIRDRLPILTRSLDTNKKRYLDEERFLYSDEALTIDPVEGEIWPNSQAEISIIFSPKEATNYSRVAFCDVVGRESRLPLKMRGEGVGPRCQFSFDTLDIQNVFVNSAHAYEVVLENKGDIESAYALVPSETLFGPKFTFAPNSGMLRPGGLQAIQISFRSTELGVFDEEFQWQVDGAPKPLKLIIRGEVIGPTFQFDVPQIKFGTISYGFMVSREITLSNTSEIPMTFHFKVPSDDDVSPPTAASPIPCTPSSSSRTKEFEIVPQSGTLPPNFHEVIHVNFTPAYVKNYSSVLVMDVDEAGKEIFSLPILAKSVVPQVNLLTPLLDYGRCFLQHPYVNHLELLNDSNLPVKYEIPPQVDQSLVVYSTPHPKGVIEQNSTLSIPFQIETQMQGEIGTTAIINIVGSTEPPLQVGIYCIGEGPVINIIPKELQWGVCPVLKPIRKTVMISNESLIPAEFECVLSREKSIFTVDPISAVIEPEQKLELGVTAVVDDCLKFSDKVNIVVSNGINFTISLSAEGQGTTIVSHPSIHPGIDLGPHFSGGPCQKQFTFTNRGRRTQALSWTTEGFSAAKLKKAEIEKKSRDWKDVALKHRLSNKTLEVKKPVFEIIPNKFVLEPYQSHVATLIGHSETPMPVNERMICHAIIGRNPHKERIMTVDISATFIAPLLEFSSQELFFQLYQPPGSKLVQHTQELGVRNVSPLSVTAVVSCSYPFSIVKNSTALAQMDLLLNSGENSTITVLYDSTYCVDKHSHTEDTHLTVAYKEHAQKDLISLKSEVHFPNLYFESQEVEFGCILNDTETIRYITMTNNSPLEVSYQWSFLKRPPVRRVDPEQLDEGVDMQSECETDTLESISSSSVEESSSNKEEGDKEEVDEDEDDDSNEHLESGSEVSKVPSIHVKIVTGEEEEQELSQRDSKSPSEQDCSQESGSQMLDDEELASEVEQEVIESGLPHWDSQDVVLEEQESTSGGVGVEEESTKRKKTKKKKREPQPWESVLDPFTPISIEQVFDILPLHGVLPPGQSQQVQFTFYGHADIATEVIAACKVEGGPTYQLRLSGDASNVQYKFSTKHIDLGQQLYDQVQSTEIVLLNRGKVDIDFCAMGVGEISSGSLAPEDISISPAMGHIPSLENQTFIIRYLPGVPAKFTKTFEIQVAHFEPDVITVSGEAVFPRIAFDLPREIGDVDPTIQAESVGMLPLPGSDDEGSLKGVSSLKREAEIERLVVKSFVLEHSDKIYRPVKKSMKPKPVLPDFHLDFGYVIHGQVDSRNVTLTNVGSCPVSFTTAHQSIEGTGFSIDLGDKIKALPPYESIDCTVRFDPIKCELGSVCTVLPFNLVGGPVYPLKLSAKVTSPSMELSSSQLDFGTVLCGQCKSITLRLTNPFAVRCEWSAITDKPPKKIPRHVPLHVRKKMKEKPPPKFFEVEPPSGILLPDQHMDIRVRFMPSEEEHYVEKILFGIKQNSESSTFLHVEGLGSEPQIEFDRTLVEFEPNLPFSPGIEAEVTVSNSLSYPVEFYSLEFDKQYTEEEEILRWLKDYDKQGRLFLPPPTPGGSLSTEILQAYKRECQQKPAESDNKPPEIDLKLPSEASVLGESLVSVGQHAGSRLKLPSSIELQQQQQVGTYEPKTSILSTTGLFSHPELSSFIGSMSGITDGATTLPSYTDVEVSPVFAAIAHYLGFDLSPEAIEAENRRGVAVIVHGPPSSGKTAQAKFLGEKYNTAVLNIDDVLIEAISSASTPAGCKARECCIQAIQVKSDELPEAVSTHSATSKKQLPKEKDKEKETPEDPMLSPVEPAKPFPVNVLEGTKYASPEGTLLPTFLEPDLVKEILSDRLQHQDCRRGIIVDGVESQFVDRTATSLALILNALNNRKHIYFVNLEMELQAINERLEQIEQARLHHEEEEERKKQEAEEREVKRISALLDLDEDEYEALSEEQKAEIDHQRLERKKERRLQRQREKEEQERLEKELEEEEKRRIEEEKLLKKKGKSTKPRMSNAINSIKPPMVAALVAGSSVVSRPDSQSSFAQKITGNIATASTASIHSGVETPSGGMKRDKAKGGRKMSGKQTIPEGNEELSKTPLERKFTRYETECEGLKTLLEDWDRQKGVARPKPQAVEEETKTTPSRKGNKSTKQKSSASDDVPRTESVAVEENRDNLGIPLITVQAEQTEELVSKAIIEGGLPSVEEILEGLGLGEGGPTLPEPVTLQIYPFPLKRRKIDSLLAEKFSFIASSPDDPNAPQKEEKSKVPPEQEDIPAPAEKEPPSASRMSKRATSVRSGEGSDSGGSQRKSPQKAVRKRSSLKASSPLHTSVNAPKEDRVTPEVESEVAKPTGPVKLVKFRWVVPAGGQIKLKLLFSSKETGQFDQILNFEIVGTRRRMQLFCRGLCIVPTVCREPRIVFPNRKKKRDKNEIVHKRFVISENVYHFGPLHCGKTRERYKEGRYPENMDTLTISNNSIMETQVDFYFRYDENATTFLLNPPSMSLQPGESNILRIWAYPKSAGEFKDSLVCCVKHNPDPVVFQITCDGVEPEIKVDKKILEFKKVLLHRKQTNVLHLHNHTKLPVAWKLSGLESLGDEFSFSQDHGIVQPLSDFPLCVHFRAAKQVNYTKKNFKIEISDVEQIMGLMHVEAISITAEAYDVCLDVSFPRGAEGGLDFQCIKVCDEHKLVLQLKNKGKYDIKYEFSFTNKTYSKLFSISPTSNTLYPGDKAQAVSVTFRAFEEVTIKNFPILNCQVIDPHLGETGEIIANIPISMSARAVFSHFSISPIDDINFGSLVVNTRKSASFTLENKGEFEFKYAITKKLSIQQQQQQRAISMVSKARTKSREGRLSSARLSQGAHGNKQSLAARNRDVHVPQRTEVLGGIQRLVLDTFTVNQATGTIQAGQSQSITVDCIADKPGKHEETLSIEISDRQKDSPPVSYKIGCEVLVPGINLIDIASIFEEHRICRQLGVLGQHQFHEDGCVGVYGEEEKRFLFKSVIVGKISQARFKISNTNKIPCDVHISVKTPVTKQKGNQEAFEVEPSTKVAIPSHSFVYATVTFKPSAMQLYSATFEAVPDGTKGKGLSIELQGEGNLPQVSIIRPTLRNPKGNHLLLFRRLLLHQEQILPLTLKNTGSIPATVLIETTSGSQSFTVLSSDDNKDTTTSQTESSLPPPLAVHLPVSTTQDCMVMFKPHALKKCRGELCVRIQDNQFEKLPVQLIGEGYEDVVCIENIRGQLADEPIDIDEVPEDVDATVENHLSFGAFPVGETRQVTFTLTNHSQSSVIRFQWPSLPYLSFTPSDGHVKPNSSKDIAVTFKSTTTQTLKMQKVIGKLWKISFSKPLSEIPDWDNRLKTIRWVNVPQSPSPQAESSGADGKTSTFRPSGAPGKKKVIETEQEPPHSVVDDSHRDLELFVSAVTNFVKYECSVREVTFRDTMMYQTRLYTFPLKNVGEIPLSYRWVVTDSDGYPITPHSSQLQVSDSGSVISEGGEAVPFTVTPACGEIQPNSEITSTLRFSPLDATNKRCSFKCIIPNLDSSCSPLVISVEGQSLMPYCHFELEHSDYLSQRGAGSVFASSGTATIDHASTRVIEFGSCGIGVKNIKRFHIINPTNSGYEFQWVNKSTAPVPFKCLTPSGYVEGGKKYEMVFEYLPSSLEVIESLWQFSISSLSLSHSFLLVGHTTEPSVNLDRAYVTFKSVLLGTKVLETVYLVNNESTPYHFAFVERSCHCAGHAGQLVVKPMSGLVQPNTKLPIEISFTVQQEKEFNFNLQCNVKRKPTPLVLNVKAEGYAINAALNYISPDGMEANLPVARSEKRLINFGHVPVNERALGQVSVSNTGQYNFEYQWVLSEQYQTDAQPIVSIVPVRGMVEPNNRVKCELAFAPPSKMTLKGCELRLEVVNGPSLPITLKGSGVEPQVDFSFEEFDFGPRFIHRTDMPASKTTVTITNNDKKDISVNCLFENQPYMSVKFEAKLLTPGESQKAVIEFRPKDTLKYCEQIVFEINTQSKKTLTIRGEGARMRIELENPAQKVVNFGALRIGDKVNKNMKLINYSPIPLSFTLSLVPSSRVPELQEEGVLAVQPTDEVTIKGNGGSYTVSALFNPRKRVPQFSEEVTLECLGVSQPLFVVTGCCHGLEVSLDSNRVPFGAVVQHSQSSRRILMINSGDIGARFLWDHESFAPDFSISPVEGYISPGMQITFDLVFHPTEIKHDIRYESLTCQIEGSDKPLLLTLSGVCIEKVPFKEVLHFTTNVRSKETRHLTIHNKSNSKWLLRPLIDGEYWSGPETLSIGPNQARHYELTYQPLTMTPDSMQKHHGSIFFPQPDGTGLLYNLQGTAEAPKHTGAVSQEIPCKTSHTELLAVENWLRRPQRFKVSIDMIRPDKLDRSMILNGLDYIDVPPLGKRDYKLTFYSYKESSLLAKVTFRNEQTGEYLYYHVSFKSTPPGIMGTFDLSTAIRKSVSDVIKITNPLPSPVTMSTHTNVQDITIPSTFTIGAQSEGKCTFAYLPLKVGETTGKLSLQSSDLGVYQYELRLSATSAPPEKPVHFTTHLGSNHQQQCTFISYAKGRTDYTCKIDNTDFHVERTITVASNVSGTEVNVDVTFEPSHLGDTHTTLTISSQTGGDYIIPLHGHCLAPKPQGPFTIKPGSSISVPFKNVFTQTTQFVFATDNPVFLVKPGDNLKPRKMYNVLVTYDAKQADPSVIKTGKLCITSQRSAKPGTRATGGITWVFYLKGAAPT